MNNQNNNYNNQNQQYNEYNPEQNNANNQNNYNAQNGNSYQANQYQQQPQQPSQQQYQQQQQYQYQQQSQQQYQQYQQPQQRPFDPTMLYSILSYIGPLFIVGIAADPKNPKVRFHCNQGLVLFLSWLILAVGFGILRMIFSFLHIYILSTIFFIFVLLSLLGAIPFIIIGIVNAANNEQKPLPIIGRINILK